MWQGLRPQSGRAGWVPSPDFKSEGSGFLNPRKRFDIRIEGFKPWWQTQNTVFP